MELLIGDEFIKLNEDDLRFIGSGREGIVYQYGSEAIKLYNSSDEKVRLNLEDAAKLTEIDTARVLLPRRIIRNPENGAFLGYTTEFISKVPIMDLFRMSIDKFADEIDTLKSDVMVLADCGVIVDDFIFGNTVFTGSQIYLVDPGSFRFRNYGELAYNLCEFRDYVVYDLLCRVAYDSKRRDFVQAIFVGYDNDVSDIIRETSKKGENVKQYVKRITKI